MGLLISSAAVGQNTLTGRQKMKQRPVAQHQATPPQIVRVAQQPTPNKGSLTRKFNLLATAAPALKFDQSDVASATPNEGAGHNAKAVEADGSGKGKSKTEQSNGARATRPITREIHNKSRLEIMEDATGKIWGTHLQLWKDASTILLHMLDDVRKASSPAEAAGIYLKSGVDLHVTALDGSIKQVQNTVGFIGELLKKMGGA